VLVRGVAVVLAPAEGTVLRAAASIVPNYNRNPAHICPNSSSHSVSLLMAGSAAPANNTDPQTIVILRLTLTERSPDTQEQNAEATAAPPGIGVPSVEVRNFVRGVTKADRCRGSNVAQKPTRLLIVILQIGIKTLIPGAGFDRDVARAGMVARSRGCHSSPSMSSTPPASSRLVPALDQRQIQGRARRSVTLPALFIRT
jgi:hypothetical protein